MQIIQLVSIFFSIVILLAVTDLIRRNLLKEQYALLWLFSSFMLLMLSVWRDLIDRIADFAGIAYPPSLLFLISFVFLLLIVLHYSVIISKLSKENKALAQEIALIKEAIYKQEKEK